MLRPLCFAKWDKIFYLSGQQWLGASAKSRNKSRAVGRSARNHKFFGAQSQDDVAQNPRSIGIWCLCPEIFLTVQGRRRFLSLSSVGVKGRWQCL
jgi:hypothetical protein